MASRSLAPRAKGCAEKLLLNQTQTNYESQTIWDSCIKVMMGVDLMRDLAITREHSVRRGTIDDARLFSDCLNDYRVWDFHVLS